LSLHGKEEANIAQKQPAKLGHAEDIESTGFGGFVFGLCGRNEWDSC
jgi:hypothetical protein